MKGYSRSQIDKIGNTLIYLSEHIQDLNKTKILKILFLLEEACIKKYGYPFFNIDFQIWQHGPVAKDVFIDLSDENPAMFANYIEKDPERPGIFKKKNTFSDAEFSDNDFVLLDLIIAFAKDKNARTLVEMLHGDHSLWRRSAIKFGILEQLGGDGLRSTNYEIDFNLLFEDNEEMRERYESALETRDFIRAFKS